MSYDRKTVGQNIRNFRLFYGMTQKQLANRAHLSLRFYRKLEQGSAGMSLITLGSLCIALRIRPNVLLLDDPSQSANPLYCLNEILASCPLETQKAARELLLSFLQNLPDKQKK